MSKYKVYPSYKDSGVDWLGKIPEHWKLTSLKFLVNIKDGTHDTPKYVDPSEKSYPLITSKDTSSGYIDFSKAKHISEADYKNINSRSNVVENDIIMPMIGSVGNPVIVKNSKPFSIKNVALFKTSESHNDTKYLYYYIDSNTIKTQFQLQSRGGVQDFVSLGLLQNTFAFKIPKQEQKTIANYLDIATAKIDTLIEKQTRLIALLKEKRQAVIYTAVTRGLDSSVPMKESGVERLGEIPMGWEAMKLKFISTVNDDTLPDNTSDDLEIKYIDIGSVTTGYIQNYEKMSYSDAPSRARRIIKSGDILVSTVRTYLKAIAPVSVKFDNYIASTGFAVIRSGDELDSNFTKYALLSNYFIDLVESHSVGVSYPAINASDLITFSIAIPSTQEQQTIAQYLDDKTQKIDNLITKATKAIDLLKERRTALISAVVTGKVDVREAV